MEHEKLADLLIERLAEKQIKAEKRKINGEPKISIKTENGDRLNFCYPTNESKLDMITNDIVEILISHRAIDFRDLHWLTKHCELRVRSSFGEDVATLKCQDLKAAVYIHISENDDRKLGTYVNEQTRKYLKEQMNYDIVKVAVKKASNSCPEVIDAGFMSLILDQLEPEMVKSKRPKTAIVIPPAILMFPDKFKKICHDAEAEGCYIIPSSIEELILIFDNEFSFAKYADLNEAVEIVNSTLDKTEVLSDHCYYYSALTNDIHYVNRRYHGDI